MELAQIQLEACCLLFFTCFLTPDNATSSFGTRKKDLTEVAD